MYGQYSTSALCAIIIKHSSRFEQHKQLYDLFKEFLIFKSTETANDFWEKFVDSDASTTSRKIVYTFIENSLLRLKESYMKILMDTWELAALLYIDVMRIPEYEIKELI